MDVEYYLLRSLTRTEAQLAEAKDEHSLLKIESNLKNCQELLVSLKPDHPSRSGLVNKLSQLTQTLSHNLKLVQNTTLNTSVPLTTVSQDWLRQYRNWQAQDRKSLLAHKERRNASSQASAATIKSSGTSSLKKRKKSAKHNVKKETPLSEEMVIEHHRVKQAQMSDELVRMVSLLKQHSTAFQDILKSDVQVMDELFTQMDTNVTSVKREGQRIQQVTQETKQTTAIIWTAVFYVVVAFSATFAIIRLLPKQF